MYINAIQDIYLEVGTCFRTPVSDTQFFPVEVAVHRESILSHLLFIVIMDVITHHIHDIVP